MASWDALVSPVLYSSHEVYMTKVMYTADSDKKMNTPLVFWAKVVLLVVIINKLLSPPLT